MFSPILEFICLKIQITIVYIASGMVYNRPKLLKTFPLLLRYWGQLCLSFVIGRFTFIIRLGYFWDQK